MDSKSIGANQVGAVVESMNILSTFPNFIYFHVDSNLLCLYVLRGPRLEFPHPEKTGRGPVSTRLVFLVQRKLIGAL